MLVGRVAFLHLVRKSLIFQASKRAANYAAYANKASQKTPVYI